MTRRGNNVSSLPTNAIGLGGSPTNSEVSSTSSFNSFFSDTALCLDCCEVFDMSFIFDNKCPICGSYVDESNIVVSDKGPDASKQLALRISKKMKDDKKHVVIKDEDIYEE